MHHSIAESSFKVWHALIFGLIIWPTEPSVPPRASPEAWQALKDVSLALELVGPHENWASDFATELRYVRRYYRLLQDAPSLTDAYWLPAPEVSRELCHFNESFQSHLKMQRMMFPYREYEISSMLSETKQLYIIWDAARRANSPNEAWAMRRRMLLKIRDMTGRDAYYSRRLPCWVPWWHFQTIP